MYHLSGTQVVSNIGHVTLKPAPYPLAPKSVAFLLLIGMVTALQAMGTTFVLPALPVIATGFGTTPVVAQQTISGFMLGLAGGQLLAGALGDRYGRRPILLIGTTLFVCTSLGCIFADTIRQLIVLRTLQGFSAAAGMILGRAIVRDTFEGTEAIRAMSTISGIISIVPMVAPVISGVFLQFLSWRTIFALLAIASGVVALLIYLRIGESLRSPDANATRPPRILRNCLEIIRRPESISFVLVICIGYGGMYSFLALMPFILVDNFGLGPGSAGGFLLLSSLSILIGTRFNNRISHRWPVRRALRFATGLLVASSLGALATSWAFTQGLASGYWGLALLCAPMFAYSFSFGMIHPTCFVMALQPVPHIAGTGSALQASFQTLAGACFAWSAAHFYDGTPLAMGVGMAMAGIAAFLVFSLVAARHAPARL